MDGAKQEDFLGENQQMGKFINITNIEKKEKGIRINFNCSEDVKDFFINTNFYTEFDENIESVPNSIAIIPLISNLLPMLWLENITLQLDEIDEDFYLSTFEILKGYEEMYPMLVFNKDVLSVKQLVKNKYEGKEDLFLFSGGIDAINTLINNKSKSSQTLTVLGSDIPTTDTAGLKELKINLDEMVKKFGINKNLYCLSNFKEFLNHEKLNDLVKKSNDDYWHGFQHGIGLLGLTTPLVFIHKAKNIFISSSFGYKDIERIKNITCASFYTIDSKFKVGSTKTIHDGVEYTRIEKVENVSRYLKEKNLNLNIHVCWETTTGNNCCKCEKCFRTIMQIVSLGIYPPQKMGFNVSKKTFRKFKFFIKYRVNNKLFFNKTVYYYKDAQDKITKNSLFYNEIKWLKKYNLDNMKKTFGRKVYHFIKKCYRFAKKTIKKITRRKEKN